ncbi:hypothetical protein [Methylobacterium sp. WL64]|uniref:hypothetical protein n=1 Tax=Methylobacterium sp. WL64 TaxID=2603894 RepID=UPI0016506FE7|nr:hypothetical protein [Methylobacterium sp. WL64]
MTMVAVSAMLMMSAGEAALNGIADRPEPGDRHASITQTTSTIDNEGVSAG